MTVYENVKFWSKIFRSMISKKTIESLLESLEIEIYKNIMVKYLSLGEVRKLELCRLVIEQRKLWILDEPYLNLDKSITNLLNETIKRHSNNGGITIFSSHFQPQIMNIKEFQLEDYANN